MIASARAKSKMCRTNVCSILQKTTRISQNAETDKFKQQKQAYVRAARYAHISIEQFNSRQAVRKKIINI